MSRTFSHSIIFCISLIFITACQKEVEYDFERQSIEVNDQRFEILTAWQIFDDYLARKKSYNKSVYQRIETEFGRDVEYPFLYESIKEEISPNEELAESIELMRNIDFARIIDSTYKIVTKELPGPDTKILFIPTNPAYREVYRDIGIGFHAFTLGTGKIIVSFDPTFDNWPQFLAYALAHEYHHSVWTSRNFETAELTPLEYMLLEGRADSFASKLFPESVHPFTNLFDEEKEMRIWNLLEPDLHSRNSSMTEKLYYGTDEIPFGTVYTMGFRIVESYKRNNAGHDDWKLIDMSPEEILEGSTYFE